MSGKVEQLTSWDQWEGMGKSGVIELEFPNPKTAGAKDIKQIVVNGLTQEEIEAINTKWDEKKKALKEPMTSIEIRGGGRKWIPDKESEKYAKYEADIQALEKLRMADLTLAFLPEDLRPPGEFEEKVQKLSKRLLAGHWGQIVNAGLEMSGFKMNNEAVEEAKNA